jgi:hypothetical protein
MHLTDAQKAIESGKTFLGIELGSVSYTHLTLPTN